MTTTHDEDSQLRYSERWADPEIATALAQVVEDSDLREVACDRLVETILHAHELAPDRWGVTDGIHFVRLNVGPAEAVYIDGEGLRIMVHEPTVRGDGFSGLLKLLGATPLGRYRSVPESVYVTLPWSLGAGRLEQALDRFFDAHEAHIEIAVASGLNGMTRKGHHPGMVDVIGAKVGVVLPQPTYVRVARPEASPGTSELNAELDRVTATEGRRTEVTLSRVERNRALRKACISYFGTRCQVCDVDLGECYGPAGAGLIHVHHLHPAAGGERETDPIRDLRPVCPNCHLVIHAGGDLRTIEEVRKMLADPRSLERA